MESEDKTGSVADGAICGILRAAHMGCVAFTAVLEAGPITTDTPLSAIWYTETTYSVWFWNTKVIVGRSSV